MKIMCVGDIHMGRDPLARKHPDEINILSPTDAWYRAVELAINDEVEALLLAGDVVDQDAGYYGVWDAFETGIKRLSKAGIRSYGVAGNHDAVTLPRLARVVKDFTLLGLDGTWEYAGLDGSNTGILGWSFPSRHSHKNPFHDESFTRVLESVPGQCIGLLHCDMVPSSPYAPVSPSQLQQDKVFAWCLGHIHKPDFQLRGSRWCGYLGSLMGLHPNEDGARGPWIMETGVSAPIVRQIPIAPLRWEKLNISLDRLKSISEMDYHISQSVENIDAQLSTENCRSEVVGLRISLIGRTDQLATVRDYCRKREWEALVQRHGDRLFFIDDMDCLAARPERSLQETARGTDPLASAARMILSLVQNDAHAKALILEAKPELKREALVSAWSPLKPIEYNDEIVRKYLLNAACQVYDALDSQQNLIRGEDR